MNAAKRAQEAIDDATALVREGHMHEASSVMARALREIAANAVCTYDERCGKCGDCCSAEEQERDEDGPDYAYEREHSAARLG
jgi:hypothetical protein